MSGGWYKQQRNIPERAWFKDANMVLLYTYLKATAYVADGKYKGQIIRRGSCPTTRSEMAEMTGLSLRTLDRTLKKLIGYGEILVKGNSQFSVVTVCDYDAFGIQESLFGSTDGTTNGITDGIAVGTTNGITPPIINNIKEERREEDTLISNSIPYKKERENSDVALEAKRKYNQMFNGILPPCIRLSTSTRISVEDCIRRFGLQSVDMVFAQIKSEQFSLGNNKTGFIANFTFIFTPKNYQQYLERAQLRQKKESKPQQVQKPDVMSIEPLETKQQREARRTEERRKTLTWMAASAQEVDGHKPAWYDTLLNAYRSGELAQLDIDWKPTNNE